MKIRNLSEFFKIDKEIVTYKSFAELVEKIKFYLKNPGIREKIAKAGQKRTLTTHTYQDRAKTISKQIIGILKS